MRSIVGGLSTYDEAFVCRFDQYFHEGKGFTRDQDKLDHRTAPHADIDSKPSVPPPGGPFNGPTINNEPGSRRSRESTAGLQAIKGQPTKALDDAVYAAAILLKDASLANAAKSSCSSPMAKMAPNSTLTATMKPGPNLLRKNISVYSVATGSQLLRAQILSPGQLFQRYRRRYLLRREEQHLRRVLFPHHRTGPQPVHPLLFAPKGERKVDYHTLEVRVRREGFTILTREGYYGGTLVTPNCSAKLKFFSMRMRI